MIEADAEVLGISADGSDALCEFGEDLGLPYGLASDESGDVRKLYDVQRRFGLGTSRFTYVVDSHGVIRNVYHNELLVGSHVQNALKALEEIRNRRP